jgi:hypothetical protein
LVDAQLFNRVLFNNCYRNYAQTNAGQLAALLQLGSPRVLGPL